MKYITALLLWLDHTRNNLVYTLLVAAMLQVQAVVPTYMCDASNYNKIAPSLK
jgi:hypothetical protein